MTLADLDRHLTIAAAAPLLSAETREAIDHARHLLWLDASAELSTGEHGHLAQVVGQAYRRADEADAAALRDQFRDLFNMAHAWIDYTEA